MHSPYLPLLTNTNTCWAKVAVDDPYPMQVAHASSNLGCDTTLALVTIGRRRLKLVALQMRKGGKHKASSCQLGTGSYNHQPCVAAACDAERTVVAIQRARVIPACSITKHGGSRQQPYT